MKDKLTKSYSKELIDAIYFEFYTKNIYLQAQLNISIATSTKSLKLLVK
ncbi:MAG: hypothetical protein JJE21_01085 [Spirochaetaceae bacterium]|nr:hypothetical protein [Spirochaetaceae bacterium]